MFYAFSIVQYAKCFTLINIIIDVAPPGAHTCLTSCHFVCLSLCRFVCLPARTCVCLSLCLPACLFVSLPVCLPVSLSLCQHACLSPYVTLSVPLSLAAYLSVSISFCLLVCLLPRLFVSPSPVCLSVCLSGFISAILVDLSLLLSSVAQRDECLTGSQHTPTTPPPLLRPSRVLLAFVVADYDFVVCVCERVSFFSFCCCCC